MQQRTSLTPYYFYSFSFKLCALCLCLVMLASPVFPQLVKNHCICPEIYLTSPFSQLCLLGLTFKATIHFIHIEIKSCSTKITLILLKVCKTIVIRSIWTADRTKDYPTLPRGSGSTKNSETTSHTSSYFSIKEG